MKRNIVKNVTDVRLVDENTPFAIREAFNLLRTNLMYTITEDTEGCPVYAMTSAGESTGKSTVIANLALSFTNLSKRVLLIDGDMRCPSLHRFFQLNPKQSGLSELLSGIETDVMIRDVRPGLDIISSGRIPPNPSELVTGSRFAELLAEWKTAYDIIFIDFPPVDILTDALAVSQSITGYLFTVRSGKNNAKAINGAIHQIEKIGAKIVGVILNDYNMKGTKSYHYGHYYQSSISHRKNNKTEHSAEFSEKKEIATR